MGWLMEAGDAPTPGIVGLIVGLVIIMGLSIVSAVSGVGRGIKYLSNLNLVLSLIFASYIRDFRLVSVCHDDLWFGFD